MGGVFGDYSYTPGSPPCPDGCGGLVYVVEHKKTWTNGTPLIDVSGGYESLPWASEYFEKAWPKPLTPGTYDLILDLNVGDLGLWTNITNPFPGESFITDPIWTIYVTAPLPPETEDVYIDIKPESCPNPINPGKKGLQSVAVLGTEEFDVTSIDPSTIRLTREWYEEVGVAPIRWSYEDVATPYVGELCDCHEEGADGYIDLTLKFETQELVSTLELEKVVGEILPLTLTGNLKDGKSFEGQDCIGVLEKGKK